MLHIEILCASWQQENGMDSNPLLPWHSCDLTVAKQCDATYNNSTHFFFATHRSYVPFGLHRNTHFKIRSGLLPITSQHGNIVNDLIQVTLKAINIWHIWVDNFSDLRNINNIMPFCHLAGASRLLLGGRPQIDINSSVRIKANLVHEAQVQGSRLWYSNVL